MFTNILFPNYTGFALLAVEFLLAGGLVLALSIILTRKADLLERLTPLSEMWIGMLLLAFVTSLPEAVNSIGATLIDGALDLGVGNLAGSNMFNIVIVVMMDFAQGRGSLLLLVANSQIFVAAGGMLVMGLVGCAIARYIPVEGVPPAGLWTGVIFSITIFVAFLAINWLLVNNKDETEDETENAIETTENKSAEDEAPLPTLTKTIVIFVITSLGVVLSALWLLRICDEMSIRPIVIGTHSIKLGHSFVGSFLLALATSLPELFVSLGALKLGRVNMSIANIFGSNIMNMSFIPMMHLVSRQPDFYSAINPSSLVMLFAALIMSTLFIVGLIAKSKRSFMFLGWEAITILAVYLSAAILVFRMAAH